MAVQTHRDFCILGLRLLGLNQRITTGSYHCVFGMDASMRQKDAQTEKNSLASAFPNQFFSPLQHPDGDPAMVRKK